MFKSILVLLGLACITLASHGRFGTIKFVKSVSDPQTVTFTFDAVFRRTYFSGPPAKGATIRDANFAYGDGNSLQIPMLVTEINTVEDWVVVQWTGTKRYAAAGTYTVGWTSCCRINALNNNAGRNYAHTAVIKILSTEISKAIATNNSPVSSMLPIIEVPFNIVPFTYEIRATDPENNALTYTMATAAQQGDSVSTHPSGLSVNSQTGVVTLSSRLAVGYWTTQQIVTDTFGNWISIDYLLNVQPVQSYCNGMCIGSPNPVCVNDADCATCNTTCVEALPRLIVNDIAGTAVPKTNLPSPMNSQTFNRNVGQQVVVNFVADDANLRNPANGVTIYASATPSGSVFETQVPCTAAYGCTCVGCNALPQLRTLTWTPTSNDLGSNTICVGVKSLANYLPYSQHCITINVIALPITSGALTTKPLTTSPLSTQPLTTQPLTTQEMTTQPLTTQSLTTKPLTTQPLTTQPLTTQPLTTQPLTTQELTTESLTTQELTTQELTTQELTTQELTTQELTTQELTTQELTTQELTTQELTTQELTTQPLTTQELTTQELTTQELTTQELTTQPLTTQPLTTQPLTTQPLTTSFATVASRCLTYTWPETMGYFCAADGSGYYQCLKGPWAVQANFRPCAPGTSCKCPVGVECSSTGICTFGAWNGPY